MPDRALEHLRRLVAIELKLGEFKPGDKGQMELYLKWLDRYERKEGEEKPIGLILCAGMPHEVSGWRGRDCQRRLPAPKKTFHE